MIGFWLLSIICNTWKLEQKSKKFAGDSFNYFFNENIWILNKISRKYVLEGSSDNNSSLNQVMAWFRTGDKPLPESMMTQLSDAYMRHSSSNTLNI